MNFITKLLNKIKMSFTTSETVPTVNRKDYLLSEYNKLNEDQKRIVNDIDTNDKINVCIPTGVGKGYMMFYDILDNIESNKVKTMSIVTHRLMLNDQHSQDIFKKLYLYAGEIGFIIVGSVPISLNDENQKLWNPIIKNYNIGKSREDSANFRRLIKQTTSQKDVNDWTNDFLNSGKKVIIISTYQSLSSLKGIKIDKIYCDEAHILATGTEKDTEFKNSYLSLDIKKSVFFTATPKDLVSETDPSTSFLMNNENIFGKRFGLDYGECIVKGYIVKPIIHLSYPSNDIIGDLSLNDKVKFVQETFDTHDKFVNDKCITKKLRAKMLIKCSGVQEMWELHSSLVSVMKDVIITAGASKGEENSSNDKHKINNETINNRNNYLSRLKTYGEEVPMIVLHVQTMTEGINISYFTGVFFLLKVLPTEKELIQNIGRGMRLNDIDRVNLKNGSIDSKDLSKWVKPFCSVIIPHWNSETIDNSKVISDKIYKISKTLDYKFDWQISLGNDMAEGKSDLDMPLLNDRKKKKMKDLVEKIQNHIDTFEMDEENIKRVEKLEGYKNIIKNINSELNDLF